MRCTNWNVPEDYVNTFWDQNLLQFWIDTEFPISDDTADWHNASDAERTAYKFVLAGLTGLDTQQGGEGMPLLAVHTEDGRQRAVMTFMGAMEQIHAKSYSTIFTTLTTSEDTSYLLDEWAPTQPNLRYKSDRIGNYYRALLKPAPTVYERYMACVASVFLESFLFYSGFYYPLYQAGHGKLTTSGEVIRKIMIDESIHGLFIGYVAQELYGRLSEAERKRADEEVTELLSDLHANELEYTRHIYDPIGLTADVVRYVEYNADRALMQLGFEARFNPGPYSAIVANAVSGGTVHHDFFSKKGDGYVKTMNIVPLTDADFIFD